MCSEEILKWVRENQANLEYIPWGEKAKYKWVCYYWFSPAEEDFTGEGNSPEEAIEDLVRQHQ